MLDVPGTGEDAWRSGPLSPNKKGKKSGGKRRGRWVKVSGGSVPQYKFVPYKKGERSRWEQTSGGTTPRYKRVYTNENDIARLAASRQEDLKKVDRMTGGSKRVADSSTRAEWTRKDFAKNDANTKGTKNNPAGGTTGGTTRGRPKPNTRRNAPQNQLDSLVEELFKHVGGTAPNLDFEKILDKNLDAINRAYDAEKNAILRNNKRARRTTRRNREDLESLYKGLARAYNREAERQDKETRQEVKQAAGIYNTQAKQAKNQTQGVLRDQAKMMKNLGIEAAGAETIPGQNKDLLDELGDIRKEKSQAKQRVRNLGDSQERYLNTMEGLALHEGTQRSADQLEALRDYIFNNRTALQDVAARRGQSLAEAEGNLAGQQAEMQQQYENDVWDRLMDVAGFKLDVDTLRSGNKLDRMRIGIDRAAEQRQRRDTQFDNALDLRKFLAEQQNSQVEGREDSALSDTALGKASQIFSENLSKPRATKVMSVFNNVLNQPAIVNGFRMVNGEEMRTTPEIARQIAMNMGRRQGLQGAELRLLLTAVLEYMGR